MTSLIDILIDIPIELAFLHRNAGVWQHGDGLVDLSYWKSNSNTSYKHEDKEAPKPPEIYQIE